MPRIRRTEMPLSVTSKVIPKLLSKPLFAKINNKKFHYENMQNIFLNDAVYLNSGSHLKDLKKIELCVN